MMVINNYSPEWNPNENTNNFIILLQDLTGYQQGAASCMIIAAIVCAAGTIWGCIACFLCCCKACLNHPLPVFPIIALILNIIAISLYAANTPELEVDTIGYSMWIAIVSVLVLAVDAVVGIFLCKCCSMCCIWVKSFLKLNTDSYFQNQTVDLILPAHSPHSQVHLILKLTSFL